jgi:cell division protein FtsZ
MINLDFADVNTVMAEMGRAMMGTGEASGERRALDAAEAAIANPLLENICMRGAQGVLINITGGNDVTLYEIDEAATRIGDEIEGDANIIFGSCLDDEMEGKIRVSVVATGIPSEDNAANTPEPGRLTRQTSATSTGISSARSAPAASSSQDMLSQHHTQSAAPKTDPQTQSTEDAAPQTLAERMAFSQKADETAHKEAEDLPEMNKPVFTAHSQVAKPQTQVAKPQVADSAKPRFYQEQPAPDRDREFSTSTKSSAATQSPERFIPEAPLATRPSGNRMALNIPNTAPAPEETPAQSYGATESNLAVDTHALAENGAAHTPTYQETQPQPHATEDHNGEGIGSGLRRSLFGITRRSATSQNTPSATPDQAASLSANPADRLVPTQPDSNELDIPTFLRRKQAN